MSVTHHGIKLAANAVFENFVVEQLATDPIVTQAGRAWFNTTDKEWKLSSIDGTGALEIITLPSEAELLQAVSDLETKLASTDADKGSSLVGFTGQAGANGKFSVDAGTLQASLQSVINALDGDVQALADYIASNDTSVAQEAATRAAADGDLTALTTTAKDNLVNSINEVKLAMETADSALDTKIDTSVAALVDGAPGLLDTLNELAAAIGDDSNFSATIANDIANAKAELKGAASTAMDTMGEIEAVIGDWTTKSADITATDVVGSLNELQQEIIDASATQTSGVTAVQSELDTAEVGAGLETDGTYAANASANYITTATSLKDADNKLDTALKTEETARTNADTVLTDNLAAEVTNRTNAITTEETTRADADNALQAELDSTQTGAGLAVSGGYIANTNADYIATATSLNDADVKLDAALKTEETARIAGDDALDTRVTNVEGQVDGKIGDLTTLTTTEQGTIVGAMNEVDANADATQAELDVTQTGAGLTATGEYAANGTSNYVSTATSLKDADNKLDAALKVEETARIATQSELDTAEVGAGLETDGTYAANVSANYVSDATSLKDADNKLDAAIKAEETARISEDNALDTRVTDLEANVGGSMGDLATLTTDNKDSVVGAINEVDSHVDANLVEINAVEAGAGLAENGAYVVPTGTSYLDASVSLSDADLKLDTGLAAEKAKIDQEILDRTAADDLKLDLTGGVLTGVLNMSENTIINVATPVGDKDAVNKVYVDQLSAGVQYKDSVRVTTTENITLSGLQTIDSVTVEAGDRVLVKDQTNKVDNGVYVVASGAWSRALDFDDDIDSEVVKGAAVLVREGGINAKIGFVLLGNDIDGTAGLQVGSDELQFSQFSGTATIIAGSGITKSGNELSINMGAGIVELPSDEIGIDLATNSGLFMTEDGTTSSEGTDARLAIQIADSSLTNSATGIKISDAFITTFYDEIGTINNELDATQVGAGLGTDGTYTAPAGTNFLVASSSLQDADVKLDAALKAEETARIAADDALDLRVDDLESSVGGNTGDLSTLTTTYKDDLVGAINEIDANTDAAQAELDATQAGAGLAATGAYNANASANYIATATTLNDADVKLDAALKSEETDRIAADAAIQSDLDDTKAAISADGAYPAKTTSNYLSGTTNLNGGVDALDAALKAHVDAQIADTGASTVGYDGATGVNGNFSLGVAKVDATIDSIVEAIDADRKTASDLKTAINSTKYVIDSASALTHVISHNLGSAFVDVKVWVNDGGVYKNVICGEEITDNNTVTITLTQAFPVRVVVQSMDQLA